jgi:hypothetical protein
VPPEENQISKIKMQNDKAKIKRAQADNFNSSNKSQEKTDKKVIK